MSTHRYCLLGLPRTGSQYIAGMISQTIGSIDLAEPFTEKTLIKLIGISENKRIIPVNIQFDSYEERIKYVFERLTEARLDQSLVMRLFLVDSMEPYIADIVKRLTDLNFKFIVIQRENVEHHLLSFLIALHTNKWNTLDNNQPHPIDSSFEIVRTGNAEWLYKQRGIFNTMLSQLNIKYDTIRYEHAIDDLEKYLGIPVKFNPRYQKQITGDPYNLISNAPKVKQFLEKLLKDENNTDI
jgi:hypothetical protein